MADLRGKEREGEVRKRASFDRSFLPLIAIICRNLPPVDNRITEIVPFFDPALKPEQIAKFTIRDFVTAPSFMPDFRNREDIRRSCSLNGSATCMTRRPW